MKTTRDQRPTKATELRWGAEERLDTQNLVPPPLPRNPDALQKLVHELEIYQIELEMQNAELRRANEELELARNKFSELYDFAPVGYFTFDGQGMIKDVNLTGTQLLGVEKHQMAGTPFSSFITDREGREVFSHHLADVLRNKAMQSCAITLKAKDGTEIHGKIQSITVDTCCSVSGCVLSSLVDDTPGRQFKEALEKAHANLELLVTERTSALTSANAQLRLEIKDRQNAETSCEKAYAEIVCLQNRLQAENTLLQHEVARDNNFGQVIGQSHALAQVFLRVEQVAPMQATVLLLGETGTGKGVIARAIHGRSGRKERSMITINCTSLPANLIESELFGREKGAFTGSHARQIGRFELADGGTIFLDEIGEMPLELQPKLLRVIQDGEFERLGSPRTIKTDVRIIAASNRNLEEEVSNGRFREDLFYRLNVFPITIPPLRQRREDIPLLVNHFVAKFNKKMGKKIESVSQETLDLLQEYHWPGNVRELESAMERAVIISQGTALEVLDRFAANLKKGEPTGQEVKALTELEHDHILLVLQKTSGRIEEKNGAAVLLGLNPSTLRARMRKLEIPRQ
jgi:PAS domain S-box-containing protein